MKDNGKIVVFGAGATGRGHVGLLCWQAGFDIVFVDKKPELVQALQEAGGYTVHLYGQEHEQINVTGCRYLHSEARRQVAAEIADAELVLTAVFDQNLPDVAVTLAQAVAFRQANGNLRPLNCIACENMMDSSSTLGRYVRQQLSPEGQTYLDATIGFPDCMISRVVPRPVDPLTIVAEDYNEWTTRREAFKGDEPVALTALELVDNQTARLERKLFVHNGGHAVCGYVGFHRGWKYIHEAVDDPVVGEHVLGALDELGTIVCRTHGFSRESVKALRDGFGAPRGSARDERRDPASGSGSGAQADVQRATGGAGAASGEAGLASRLDREGHCSGAALSSPQGLAVDGVAGQIGAVGRRGGLWPTSVASIPPRVWAGKSWKLMELSI